jgi:hypothetical protein
VGAPRNDPALARFHFPAKISNSPRPPPFQRLGTSIALLPLRIEISAGDFTVARRFRAQAGKVGWILLWLLGVPIPILIILFLIRGCT